MIRQIHIPVRLLSEYALRSGDIEQDLFSGGNRAAEGIQAHKRIQDSRPSVYRPEVTVSHHLTRFIQEQEYHITISGRIDGIFEYPSPRIPVIDEIKSVSQDPDSFEEKSNPMHWGQAIIYAYIIAAQRELDQIDVQLTYIREDEETRKVKIREYVKNFPFPELEDFFNHVLTLYLQWADILENWKQVRNTSIEELKYPYTGFRPGQRKMALDIYRAIENSEQWIIEAPTGTGKTIGALFPAIKAMSNEIIEKFFYLTAKTTGRSVAQKAIHDLGESGLRLKTVTITAKEKTCFNPEGSCSAEECEYARGFFDRINDAVKALFQKEDQFTREIIEDAAREFCVCPFEYSLELALWVDGIICDYNYAFNPRVYLKRFFGEETEPGDYAFLVDEANNLVDRSREMFSAELYKKKFLDFRRELKKQVPSVSRAIGTINSTLLKLKSESEEEGKPITKETCPDELLTVLFTFIRAAEKWLKKNIKTAFRKQLMELYFDVSWFLKVAENYTTAYITCFETIDEDFRVKLFCIDPSGQLEMAFDRGKSSIFFSATLAPIPYFKNVLGCNPSAGETVLPSPFPRENLCLLVANRVSTLYKYREQTKGSVAQFIDTLVREQPGNYLVFFPSYQYMETIYNLFKLMNPLVEHMAQAPGMTEKERDEFLEKFSVDNRVNFKTLVGFAVLGGVFGEGIDLVGDRLTGAVIVGVGLPGISLERELIKEYYTNTKGAGFEYSYLYPGMNRVLQAAGRVIRSGTDRGVVLLIDHRFSNTQYNSLFPRHWKAVSISQPGNLQEKLEQFWNK